MNIKLNDKTNEFLKLNGFNELTAVQKQVLQFTSSNKDVVAVSKTGTGKTHAYLIPICEMINTKSLKTQVLISLPTRELAYQVYENTTLLKKIYPDIKISLVSGGSDKKRNSLSIDNPPHIIIATPGRIKDLFVNRQIRVDTIKMFVIDEADMTLEYGFLSDLDVVFSKMIKHVEVLCFTATFPSNLNLFVKKYLANPKIIYVTDKKRDPKIEHFLLNTKHRTYNESLLILLKNIHPYMCLIFANSKEEANETYSILIENGYKVLLLHGGLDSRSRKQAIKDLQAKKFTYVVCSDVVSRGIDNNAISHVISLGFPKNLEFYIHRAGRTGRNSNDGYAYAIYNESDLNAIATLKKKGINFKELAIKGNTLKEINKKKYINNKDEALEKEIAKTLYHKKEKVKPNYKKKKKLAIEKIKRKQKRNFIKQKIKEERKERYKKQMRAKKGY